MSYVIRNGVPQPTSGVPPPETGVLPPKVVAPPRGNDVWSVVFPQAPHYTLQRSPDPLGAAEFLAWGGHICIWGPRITDDITL